MSTTLTLPHRPASPAKPAPSAGAGRTMPEASLAGASAQSSDANPGSVSTATDKRSLAHQAAAQSQVTTFTTAKPSHSAGTSVAAEKEANKRAPLGPGSTGRRVVLLQLFLVRKGHMSQEQYESKPGVFGESTAEAVRKFQNAHHLEPNGVVGPATREAILREMDDATSRRPSLGS